MQILILTLVLIACSANSIISKDAVDQFFPEIFNWLRLGQREIDQNIAFKSLETMHQLLDEAYKLQLEDKEFLAQFENQIKDVLEQKLTMSKNIESQTSVFLKDELKRTTDYLTNMIKDKEKMIDQDNRELEKLRNKNYNEKQKTENKLIEITQLLKEIESSLEVRTDENLYKIIEIIESKAVMGLFYFEKNYEEIAYFLTTVDSIFKNKNFEQDQVQIINLISLVQNVLYDIRLRILIKMQDEKMDNFDTLTFYEGTKQTHTRAKDYFEQQLNTFSYNLVQTWKKIENDENMIIEDSKAMGKWLKEFQKDSTSSVNKILSNLQIKQLEMKHVEQDFLQPIRRN